MAALKIAVPRSPAPINPKRTRSFAPRIFPEGTNPETAIAALPPITFRINVLRSAIMTSCQPSDENCRSCSFWCGHLRCNSRGRGLSLGPDQCGEQRTQKETETQCCETVNKVSGPLVQVPDDHRPEVAAQIPQSINQTHRGAAHRSRKRLRRDGPERPKRTK